MSNIISGNKPLIQEAWSTLWYGLGIL